MRLCVGKPMKSLGGRSEELRLAEELWGTVVGTGDGVVRQTFGLLGGSSGFRPANIFFLEKVPERKKRWTQKKSFGILRV